MLYCAGNQYPADPSLFEFARAEQRPGEHDARIAALEAELARWKVCGNCGEPLEGPGHCGSAVTEHEKALEQMHEETLTRAEQAEADLARLKEELALAISKIEEEQAHSRAIVMRQSRLKDGIERLEQEMREMAGSFVLDWSPHKLCSRVANRLAALREGR